MEKTSRCDFAAMVAALAGCRGCGFLAAAKAHRLNILYMTDDHAVHAIGAYGLRIKDAAEYGPIGE